MPQTQLFFAAAAALPKRAICCLKAISRDVVTCNLVMAKLHVCTPDKNTILCSEVEAALDVVKLLVVVKQELDFPMIIMVLHKAVFLRGKAETNFTFRESNFCMRFNAHTTSI